MNADMCHTYSDLSNASTEDDELHSLLAFYTEHVLHFIATSDDSVPPIPTCPAIVAVGSGIRESITTITPLSFSPDLRKKEGSSDLRVDFLQDECPIVRLAPLRRIPTAEALVQTRDSHRGYVSGLQARVVSQFIKLTGSATKMFKNRQRYGLH